MPQIYSLQDMRMLFECSEISRAFAVRSGFIGSVERVIRHCPNRTPLLRRAAAQISIRVLGRSAPFVPRGIVLLGWRDEHCADVVS
jgi:hypothetical protein